MRTANKILSDAHLTPFKNYLDPAENLSFEQRTELLSLLKTSYPHYTIDNVFEKYPDYKSLYILSLRNSEGMLIASRQIFIVNNTEDSPLWTQMVAKKLSIQRFAIGSRAIVHPNFRGQGLGKQLVQQANNLAYHTHNVSTIFGSSTSISAIKLYLRLGAELYSEDIDLFNLYNFIPQEKNARLSQSLRYFYYQPNSANPGDNIFYPEQKHRIRAIY